MNNAYSLLEDTAITRTILETVGAFIVVLKTDGTIVHFNRTCQEKTGYAETEALGRAPWDFLLPHAIRETVQGVFAKLTAGQFPSTYENVWVAKTGEKINIAWTNTVTLNPDRSIQYVIGTGIDITERTMAEENLRQSESEVRTILQTMTDTFYRTDRDGRIAMISNSVKTLLGYEVKEVIGKSMGELYVHPDQRTAFIDALQHGGGRVNSYEAELRHKDGHAVWVSSSARLIADENGAYAGIEGTSRDITETKKAADAIRRTRDELKANFEKRTKELTQSEMRLRAVTESAKDAIISTNSDGLIIQWNQGAQKMFGYTADEALGQPATIFIPERYRRAHSTGLADFINTGEKKAGNATIEVKAIHKDGREFPTELTLSSWHIDDDVFITSIIRDISDRKRDEDNLRKLSRALEQSPSAVFITDTDGIIEYVNPKFTQLTGYSAAEAIGQNPRILKSLDTPKDVHREMWATILDGKEWRGEIKDRHKNGSQFWSYVTIAPVKDDGINTHYIATHEDISQRKDSEFAVQSALKEAELASRTKSELMANMSHELRTPLNAIIGFSSTMQNEIFGPVGHEKYKEYLGDIHDSGKHLLELINDILDVSAIESGMLELHEEAIDIAEVVDTSRRLVQHRAEEGKVSLTIEIAAGLPRILADERRLKQILLNVFTNAIKFTPPEGNITLHARQNDAHEHIISITDTGIGMNKIELTKALSKFGQVDSSLSRKHDGTGLGLPLTVGLVELHGGTLNVTSAKGHGTTVTIHFPSARTVV